MRLYKTDKGWVLIPVTSQKDFERKNKYYDFIEIKQPQPIQLPKRKVSKMEIIDIINEYIKLYENRIFYLKAKIKELGEKEWNKLG